MSVLNSVWSSAWHDPRHQAEYDKLAHYSPKRLRQHWERFNEVNLFRSNAAGIQGSDLLDLGCATGEFYRYVRSVLPRFRYYGCDIDAQLINSARRKYPEVQFFQSVEDLSNARERCPSPAVVFNRDVIPFCPEPFVYLRNLLTLPSSAAVLRLRTRDHGPSELDPERSCAFLYGRWIPYMVLNVDELIACITGARAVSVLHVQKNYEILGGVNQRFLPKECYYAETGTASTAVFIQFEERQGAAPRIVMEELADAAPLPSLSYGLRRLLRPIMSRDPG